MITKNEEGKESKFTLITGLQNSGKSTYILDSYAIDLARLKKHPDTQRSYFIDVELAVSDWLNNADFISRDAKVF